MTALVTGATGFIGRTLCERLTAEGDRVRAIVRRGAEAREDTVILPDIDGDTDWRPALQGVDVVYHLAARVHFTDEIGSAAAEAYRRTNVEGTMSLARAAAAAGVRHFVFVSSVKAAAEVSGERPLRESDSPEPLDAYGQSKWEAEQALNALRDETSMHVSIIRPPLVYGPRLKANFLRLMQAIDNYVPLPLASISNRRSIIYVGNLIDALQACVGAGKAASTTFYVSDDADVSTPELIRRIAAALHRRAILMPMPVPMMRLAGSMTGRRGAVERLVSSLAVDSSAIRRELGWTAPFTTEQGLAVTAEWYRQSR